MAPRVPVEALLKCGDTVEFNPPAKRGESVICRRHGPTEVLDPLVKQWYVTCDGCAFERGYGAARLNAEIQGAKHRQRVRTNRDRHIVRLWTPDGKLHRTYGEGHGMDTLPVTGS
jgi:hypothetical protein